jgi:hypothetical protein
MSEVGLTIECRPTGRNGTMQLSAMLDGRLLYADKLDIGRASARERFAKAVIGKCDGVNKSDLEAELLKVAKESAPTMAEPTGCLPEVDVSAMVRPELFHTAQVSGMLIPSVTVSGGQPIARWWLYLRWQNGRRERRELAPALELPEGRQLWFRSQPAAPVLTDRPAWTNQARNDWLDGALGPDPVNVFKRLCERFAHFLDFTPESAAGDTAMLSLWAMLTYCYPCWSAVPYLSIGGTMGSGKSRVFEVLSRLVFRPLASANMTAAALFRTLHEAGGVLLLDEAERLRDQTPDAGDIRSILLSGYKVGTPAKRLEASGDGKFRTLTFDVFGPKAIAGIAALPEALASRCIRLVMFRAGQDSPKPRRRIDEQPEVWTGLRDDLHVLALENGPAWMELAGRENVCPAMSGRDFELWQPILGLAAWLDENGADGLLRIMQEHAARSIDLNRDDAVPDADEVLLRLLADAVMAGINAALTREELLRRAVERDPSVFSKWSGRGVSNTLKRYGIATTKSNGQRTYRDVTPAQLVRVQTSYGVDLGLGSVPCVLCAPGRDM